MPLALTSPGDSKPRSDSYEAQLSDGQLMQLHGLLMDGKSSLESIKAKMPKWKDGRYAGQPVSIVTLSNIRDRLVMIDRMKEDEATTETLLQQWKKELPELSDEELDKLGAKTFSLLALRSGDAKTFIAIRDAVTTAALEKTKLQLKTREADRLDQQLALEKEKWETLTAEKVLDAANDAAIQAIATQVSLGRKAQIALIREKMFGAIPTIGAVATGDGAKPEVAS